MSVFRTVESSDPDLAPAGFTFCSVQSEALGRRADVVFYNADGRSEDVPMIVLLHGVYGSAWSWAFQGGAHATYEKLRKANEIGEFALVMPSDGLYGDGSGYINRAAGRFEDWIAFDVIELARRQITSMTENSNIYIAGLSMGGYGALRLGALNPSTFHAISAHSAICHLADFKHFTNEDISADLLDSNDTLSLADLLISNAARLPAIRFDCGEEDILRDSNDRLAASLAEAGITHTYETLPGGHDWTYWSDAVERSFRFFDHIEKEGSSSA